MMINIFCCHIKTVNTKKMIMIISSFFSQIILFNCNELFSVLYVEEEDKEKIASGVKLQINAE